MIVHDPRTSPVIVPIAQAIIGLVRARRGDPDWRSLLDEAWHRAEPTGELQRWELPALARAEAAWLDGDAPAVDSATAPMLALAVARDAPWIAAGLRTWRLRAGLDTDTQRTSVLPPPFAAQAQGDWDLAADLWRQLHCPYEAALALADAGDTGALRQALTELQRLGAKRAAAIVARRLQERGIRDLPRGPRPATKRNQALLTEREVEVLRLLATGVSNGDIASRLFLSNSNRGPPRLGDPREARSAIPGRGSKQAAGAPDLGRLSPQPTRVFVATWPRPAPADAVRSPPERGSAPRAWRESSTHDARRSAPRGRGAARSQRCSCPAR